MEGNKVLVAQQKDGFSQTKKPSKRKYHHRYLRKMSLLDQSKRSQGFTIRYSRDLRSGTLKDLFRVFQDETLPFLRLQYLAKKMNFDMKDMYLLRQNQTNFLVCGQDSKKQGRSVGKIKRRLFDTQQEYQRAQRA